MKAITLTAPWAWAVAHAGKDVENRTRRCPSLLGERIAIHAGVAPATKFAANQQRHAIEWMKSGLIDRTPVMSYGSIVAVATVIGWCGKSWVWDQRWLDVVGLLGHRCDTSPWFSGPYGWMLHDVRALAEPVPARGKQGIWTVGTSAEARILAQIGGA